MRHGCFRYVVCGKGYRIGDHLLLTVVAAATLAQVERDQRIVDIEVILRVVFLREGDLDLTAHAAADLAVGRRKKRQLRHLARGKRIADGNRELDGAVIVGGNGDGRRAVALAGHDTGSVHRRNLCIAGFKAVCSVAVRRRQRNDAIEQIDGIALADARARLRKADVFRLTHDANDTYGARVAVERTHGNGHILARVGVDRQFARFGIDAQHAGLGGCVAEGAHRVRIVCHAFYLHIALAIGDQQVRLLHADLFRPGQYANLRTARPFAVIGRHGDRNVHGGVHALRDVADNVRIRKAGIDAAQVKIQHALGLCAERVCAVGILGKYDADQARHLSADPVGR